LTRNGFNTGKIDGIFGTKTKRAMQEFLRKSGHDVGKIDGFFGPRSVMALQVWMGSIGFSPKGPRGNTADGIWGPFTTRALQQTLNAELGASSPKRTLSLASTTAATPVVRSPNSPGMIKTSSRGTLSSMGFDTQEGEKESMKPRRSLSERRSKQTAAASAA
jgi:peptidoglycan hydrolase-like protein with peptidoglycan-binding domain